MVLIDIGNTHNFISWHKASEIHYFVHPVNNFQVLITNGGLMKCGGCCLNVKLQMGDYHLKAHMFAVDIGGCNILLGIEWLMRLGMVTMDFKELYMSFVKDSHTHLLKLIQAGPSKVISFHCMEKLLNKGHSGIIAKLHAI